MLVSLLGSHNTSEHRTENSVASVTESPPQLVLNYHYSYESLYSTCN